MNNTCVKPKVQFLTSPYGTTCVEFTGVNMGVGCSVSCIYCHFHEYIEKKHPDSIGVTFDISSVKNKKKLPQFIYLCPHTEPFSAENKENTYEFMKIVLPKGVFLWVLTKSIIPDNVIELISKYPAQVEIAVGVTNTDKARNGFIEPGAPDAGERLDNILRVSKTKCRYGARMDPIFPLIDDATETLNKTIQTIAKYGVKNLVASYLMLPANIYQKFLDIPQFKSMLQLFTDRSPTTSGVALSIPIEHKMEKYSEIAKIAKNYGMSLFVCSCRDIRLKDFDAKKLGYSLNCR